MSSKGKLSNDIRSEIENLKLQQNSCIATYKDNWPESVNYKVAGDLSDTERRSALVDNLKRHNDAYMVNMMTNSMSYLDRGLTLGNIIKSYFTYETSKIMMGSMEDSEAKMWNSFRENLRPMMNSNAFAKVFLGPIDSYLENKSANKFNQAYQKRSSSDSLDDLVMTPRQLAAMKLNFMEQYYMDIRLEDPSSKKYAEKVSSLTQKYEKAMEHIGAIAVNNGYEMSAVAAEERRIVGLKVLENPNGNYTNMFNETSSIYGAKPVFGLNSVTNEVSWDGKFQTADNHTYFGDTKGGKGAFTIRPSLADSKRFDEFKASLVRQGQEYAWMKMYLQSDMCPADDKAKKQAIEALDQKFTAYKSDIKNQIAIDLNYSDKQCKDFMKNTFDDGYNKQFEMVGETPLKDVLSVGADGPTPARFMNEIKYIQISEALISEYKLQDNEFKANPTAIGDEDKGSANMIRYFDDFCHKLGKDPSYNKDVATIMDDVVNVSVKDMNASQLVDLMMHAGSNIEQGVRNGKFTDRPAMIQMSHMDESIFKESDTLESVVSPATLTTKPIMRSREELTADLNNYVNDVTSQSQSGSDDMSIDET